MSQIPREEDSPRFPTGARIRNLNQDEAGAKNMSRDRKGSFDAGCDIVGNAIIWERLEQFDCSVSILFRIERERRIVFGQAVTISIICVFF